MVSKIYIPKPPLNEAVDLFYLNYAHRFETVSTTFPMLHQEVAFNLGELFDVRGFGNNYSTRQLTTWISGLHTKPITAIASGRHLTIGILLKPWGLYQLFGVNPVALTNTAIDTNLIIGNFLESFVREQVSVLDYDGFLPAFADYLHKKVSLRPVRQDIIASLTLIHSMDQQRGAFGRLASSLKISSKTFIQTFNQTIGLNPTQYLLLQKVNAAMQAMQRFPERKLTAIGYDLGFYDQAHFARVFKSFCGMTPKDYRNYVRGKFCTISASLS